MVKNKAQVICDLCGENYTHSTLTGGMLFASNAVCPKCLPHFKKTIKKYNEENFIRAIAIEGETFCQFVYRIRKINYN